MNNNNDKSCSNYNLINNLNHFNQIDTIVYKIDNNLPLNNVDIFVIDYFKGCLKDNNYNLQLAQTTLIRAWGKLRVDTFKPLIDRLYQKYNNLATQN